MIERHWEINGNLDNKDTGLKYYDKFQAAIIKVKNLFDSQFSAEVLNKICFYVDNATADSGYVPISTVVLGKIIVIKLGVRAWNAECNAAFQFSHELMHVVFMAVFGIDKPHANGVEESICSAAALITIHNLYPENFDAYYQYVSQLNNESYAKGVSVAEKANYTLAALMPLVSSNKYS